MARILAIGPVKGIPMFRRYLLAGGAASCLVLAASVAAQTAIPTELGQQRPTPSWTGGDIVVTGQRQPYTVPDTSAATKTNTPLIGVPQSVQVITKTLIEEQDRRTLADALVNVSGVAPTRPEEVLFTAPIIHGFPAEIYQDGLPFYGATQAANDPTSLVGVERIDVLKGPTSSLYAGGVGTPLGGLINIESVRPSTAGVSGYAAIRGGSFGTVDPYADLNVPLSATIAARISGEYQRNDSYIDQVHGNRWSVQPSLLFQFGPRTDLFVQGKFDRRSQLEYSGIPAVQALAGQIDRNAFPGASNDQPNNVIDNKLVTAILRHDFSDKVKLTVSGRYYSDVSNENGAFVYGDLFPPDPATPTTYQVFAIFLNNRTHEGTLDANLQARVDMLGGRHELLGGFNYDHTDFFSGLGFTGVPLGTQNLANPSYTLTYGTAPPIPTSPVLGGTATDRYETIAGYIQDQATYGPLHVTGSLRFTSLHFRELETGTNRDFRRVSPRIGATLDIIPGVAIYAGYATAFRGAFGVVSLTPPKPETARNVEGGVKLALAKAHLSGTISVFDQTRRNVATPDPSDFHYSIQTGGQRARGAEADITWEPTPAFSLLANYAYTDAKVTDDDVIPVGDRLPRVPRHSGRIAARYRVLSGPAKGLSFGAGVTAFSSREITLPNSVAVPGYAAVDAQGTYDFDRFTIGVSVVNLNGSRAFDSYQYLSFPVVIPTQPRSAFVTLKARL